MCSPVVSGAPELRAGSSVICRASPPETGCKRYTYSASLCVAWSSNQGNMECHQCNMDSSAVHFGSQVVSIQKFAIQRTKWSQPWFQIPTLSLNISGIKTPITKVFCTCLTSHRSNIVSDPCSPFNHTVIYPIISYFFLCVIDKWEMVCL